MTQQNRSCSRRKSTKPRFFSVEALEERTLLSWGATPPVVLRAPTNVTPAVLDSDNTAEGSAQISQAEVDYYSFVAPVSGSYLIAADASDTALNTVLGIYRQTGRRLRRVGFNNDSNGTTNSELDINLQAGKRYIFGVTNLTGTQGGGYDWVVLGPEGQVQPQPSRPSQGDDTFEPNNSMSQAADLGTMTNRRTIGNLRMLDGQDWFRFQVSSPGGNVSVNSTVAEGNLDLIV
jgi:hypothetical protein